MPDSKTSITLPAVALVVAACAGASAPAADAATPAVHPVRVDTARAGYYDELRPEFADGIVGDGRRLVSYVPASRPKTLRTRDTDTGRTFDVALGAKGCIARAGDDRSVLLGCIDDGTQYRVLVVDLVHRSVRRVAVPAANGEERVLIEDAGARWLQGRRCVPGAQPATFDCTTFYLSRKIGRSVVKAGPARKRDLDDPELRPRCHGLLHLAPRTRHAETLACSGSVLIARAEDTPESPAKAYRRGHAPIRLRPAYRPALPFATSIAMDARFVVWTDTRERPAGLSLRTGRRVGFDVDAGATAKVTRSEVVFAERPTADTTPVLVVPRATLPR